MKDSSDDRHEPVSKDQGNPKTCQDPCTIPISISDEPMTTFDQPISASLAGFFLVRYKEHLELFVFSMTFFISTVYNMC